MVLPEIREYADHFSWLLVLNLAFSQFRNSGNQSIPSFHPTKKIPTSGVPVLKGLIKLKNNIIPQDREANMQNFSYTWFWMQVPCKGEPFLQGSKEPPSLREEGKLDERSEDYIGQWGTVCLTVSPLEKEKKKQTFYAQGAYFLNKHSWF